MRLMVNNRDRFPKRDLWDGYVGDGFPLCSDLPPRSFLAKGATFVRIASYRSGSVHDLEAMQELELAPLSPLYAALCRHTA